MIAIQIIMNKQNLSEEFDRQVSNLLEKGYPKLLGTTKQELVNKIEPLRTKLENLPLPEIDLERGKLPFVIVIKDKSLPAEEMMRFVDKNGKRGVTILRPHGSANFQTIDEVVIPEELAYLLVDIDRGRDNINLPPSEAMKLIKDVGRSPLTIDEGVAIITHFPEFLVKNNCFSLLASRTGSDKRVPAIWINAKKEPNLGWCWEGNPHTWLGSASCLERVV